VVFVAVGAFLDDFFGVVKACKPDVLFVSVPREIRRLLGPTATFAEQLGCPVFELPAGQAQSWFEAASSRLAGMNGVIGKLSSRWKEAQRYRLSPRSRNQNKDS
jgi:hypothetical protein